MPSGGSISKCFNPACKSTFADKEYGSKMRAQNVCSKRSTYASDRDDVYVRCTNCGAINPRTAPTERVAVVTTVKKQKFKKGGRPKKKKAAAPKEQKAA